MNSADLLLHPVRLRVIQALAPDRRLTIGEIGAILNDVPPASLYRHVNKLIGANIIAVVEQRQRRSVTEHVYAIAAHGAEIDPRDFSTATRDDHLRYFTTFIATLLTDYARYLEGEAVDLVRDGVGYRQVFLNLSDDEFVHFAGALNAAITPFLSYEPNARRKRRTCSTIVMPDARAAQSAKRQ